MTLRASLLRELVNPNLSVGGRAELCCELAKDFENRGEYEEAREVLSGLWPRIGERPKAQGLGPKRCRRSAFAGRSVDWNYRK